MRFGDYCYEVLKSPKQSIELNANECYDKESFLWYPQGPTEFSFAKNLLKPETETDLYTLGYKMIFSDHSILLMDGSIHPGIPYYTSKKITNE